jgi:hypothetical protein
MARGHVLSAVVLGAGLAGIAFWAWAVRSPKVDVPPPAARIPVAPPEAGAVRVETLPLPPAADRARLLADAKSDRAEVRIESGRRIGRALDQGSDAELLSSLHALARQDAILEVRSAALGELVFRNDRPSFEILLGAAQTASQPAPVRLRAIELLERVARKDYGLFLANHGCSSRESDRIAAQRRDRAKATLSAADQANQDPDLRAALRKTLGKFN